ncbi:hypothetical protein OROMI_034680 [Orobanche minor]
MAQSSYRFHSVGIFAGFYPGKNVHYLEVADRLGALLAARDINIVYGGGTYGLMGRVAASAYLGKAKVLAVNPKPLAEAPFVGPSIGDDLRVSNLQDRIITRGVIECRWIVICATTAEELLDKFAAYEAHPDPLYSHIHWTGVNDRRKRKLDLTLTL